MKFFSKANLVLKNTRLVRELISFLEYGYLKETGWLRSYRTSPQDANGEPIPWLTLPFIHFIQDRLKKDQTLLEYGCGNSTRYFSERVGKVVSVEHHPEWHSKMKDLLGSHCELLLRDLGPTYTEVASEYGPIFDLILVDGRMRVDCIKASTNNLSAQGVLILDNSERKEYADGVSHMLSLGYRSIQFEGMPPGSVERSRTTVFYKNENCLGI